MIDLEMLHREIEDSHAFQIYLRFENLSVNHYVFEINYRSFKQYITVFQDPRRLHWLGTEDETMKRAMCEIIRQLHNLVASAKSLVDHTRVAIERKWYRDDAAFLQEYRTETRKLAQNPIVGFVEDLRNYTLHYRLPQLHLRGEIRCGGETVQKVYLDKQDLSEWKDWGPSKGMIYLHKADDNIPLEDVIDTYFALIYSFHQWLLNTMFTRHSSEMTWFKEKKELYNRMIQETLSKFRDT